MTPDLEQPTVHPADVEAAFDVIAPHIRKTPVLAVDPADFGLAAGAPLQFKLEFLQHSGSFKARGALTNLLTRTVPQAGVVAASGGNHGAAVAFAARHVGHPAKIFVPSVAPDGKRDRIRGYGADLVIAGDLYDDARAASQAWAQQTGALAIHAFDQPETLAGQGTVALEFAEQALLDTILVATGGGGLIGGMAAYLQGRTKLVSVEPEAAPTLAHALAAGGPVDAPAGGLAADSLAPRRIGDRAYILAAAHVSEAVLVPDPAIRDAQIALWQTLRIVTEPGGAAAFAALLSGAYRPAPDERVGILLCGANTDAVTLQE
ncbi:threonine/serine dehydratase [Actibacterium sp. 188UL27-1]|uniref:threonine/serine dehydratase n=1 Tax=Actibacterium sp. 188UL27-1 TaxID=2786961 RepID=UPI00195BF537|nr:threonine/serine dehydratase [Actibacterium sp. 188UL27-1]MBM7069339.1 threonine/serine dehydratase [Actibacterium sp. 188UL27-1]